MANSGDDNDVPTPQATYVAGLTMLARRELSESQLRQRLLRRGHPPEQVDEALARLKSERALDDARVAEAIARTEISLRGRGKLRVRQQIKQAGIAPATASRALERAYEDVDPQALLIAALDKRLRGRTEIADQKEMQRLYRYLVAQGFGSDKVISLLRRRMSKGVRSGSSDD